MSNDTHPTSSSAPTVFDTVFGRGAREITLPVIGNDFRKDFIKIDVDPEPEDNIAVQLDAAVFEPTDESLYGPGPYPVVIMPAPLIGTGWRAYYQDPEDGGSDEYPEGSGITIKLVRQGYIVVAYSQRGLSHSTGYIDVAGDLDVADGRKVIDWVRDNTANPNMGKVGFAGASYGAGTSLLIAAHDDRVKAVAALSAWADLYASLYENETRHMKAFLNLKTLFEGGVGIPRKRISNKTRQVFDNYLAHEDVENLRTWALTRSPSEYLAKYNANGTAIYLHTYYHETIFNNAAVIELFRNLTTPKRLLAQIGDHGNAEGLGLAGMDTYPTGHLYQWFARHLKCEGEDNPNTVFVEEMWKPAAGPKPFPDLAAVENPVRRRYLVQGLGLDGRLAETAPPTVTVARFTVGQNDDVSVESAPLVVLSGILERLDVPVNYNMTVQQLPPVPVPVIPGAPFDLEPHFLPRSRPLPRQHAAVWSEQTGAGSRPRQIKGRPTAHLRVKAEATRITVCVYLLVSGPLLNVGRMVTSGVFSYTNATPGAVKEIDIPMQFVNYIVPENHRMVVVVTANDPLYEGAVESVIGTPVEILSGPGAESSWVDVPI
ncbi:CocE/NonD family hydrolase [Allorhizocola rhizosphaerae]|uniref:CocE/NonD family hydrolase n=1 Tax=Allorhizocola rhizosphaerae TaxID=1872709 RepID=UPI000E3EA7B0|nr:CocE/NonD family hydrolase [Allorhizocola rhizosphaerae]